MRVKKNNAMTVQRTLMFYFRYYNNSDWVFLCQECLTPVKEQHSDYVYGGTWKAKRLMVVLDLDENNNAEVVFTKELIQSKKTWRTVM